MIRRQWLLLVGAALVLGIFIVATPWPTDVLALPLVTNESPKPADVIIVLGAGTRRGVDPLPTQAKLRTDKGIELWRTGLAPKVMISGGKSKVTGLIESNIMAGYAIDRGLASEDIILEERSTSTRENAEQSLRLMTEQKLSSAIVVTTSYHTWRSCRVFRALDASVQCVAAQIHPVPENFYERMVNFRSVVREYGAIILYVFRGYL